MSKTTEETKKSKLSLSKPGKLELKKTIESGQVRQNFSHGRSKMVQVERRTKRTFALDSGGHMSEVKGVAKMRAEGVEPVLGTLLNRWYTDEFIGTRPDAIQNRIDQVLGTPEDVFLSVFDVYAGVEMAPWLHEVACPCLVMTGEFDGGCSPRLNRFIAGELPDAELVILDDLKHSILIEAPERVLGPVKDFLLRHRDI